MKRPLICSAFVVTAVLLAGLSGQAQVQNFTPVTDSMLRDPDPADWLS